MKNIKFNQIIVTGAVSGITFLAAWPARASSWFKKDDFSVLQLGMQSPENAALSIIDSVLQLLAVATVALVIYGGIRWMLARGNEEEVTKAKDILKAALIGLIIILSALGITRYLFTILEPATGISSTT